MKVGVQIAGAREIRQAFRELEYIDDEGKQRRGSHKLREANQEIAERILPIAQANVRGLGPAQGRAADALLAVSTQKSAGIRARTNSQVPDALVQLWGVLSKRLGWFADNRYQGYTARDQGLPPWVGNSWKVGQRGEGPYGLNDAIAEMLVHVPRIYHDAVIDAARELGLI